MGAKLLVDQRFDSRTVKQVDFVETAEEWIGGDSFW